jgi:DNA-binding NtrC family response regulator
MGQGGPGVILIVDDEIDLATTFTRLLGRHGYRVIAVGSCEEARAAMRAETPALVLSDLRLPDGDGLDLVRAALAQAPPIPAIVMTGHASPGTQRAALEAGAFAFLAKPFSTATLVALVEEALRT